MKLKEYFDSFISYKKADGQSLSTIKQYEWLLSCLDPIGDKELCELKKTDDVLVKIEGRKHGEFGEQKAIILLRMFLKWMEDDGHQMPFRWDRIPVPNVRDKDQYYLTPDKFEELVEKLPNNFYGLRDRTLYELLWSTGCRIGEALAIDVKDINLEKGEIFVHTEKKGEGDTVYISDRLAMWLSSYLDRKPKHEALFIIYNYSTGEPTRLSSSSARKNLLIYRDKFGITEDLTHHSFRRGFATHNHENGVNLKAVQYLMRHRSERTTLRSYIKFEKTKLKGIHNKVYSQAPKTEIVEIVDKIINRKNA